MGTTIQLCVLLLYACSLVASLESVSQERVWHSTTPPALTTTLIKLNSTDDEQKTPEPIPLEVTTSELTTSEPVTSKPVTSDPSTSTVTYASTTIAPQTATPTPPRSEETLPEVVPDTSQVVLEESVADEVSPDESPKHEHDEASDPVQDILSVEVLPKDETAKDSKKKKPRKWISIPEEVAPTGNPEVEEISTNNSSEADPEQEVDGYSLNGSDFELPQNISDLLEAAEEGVPVVQETIVSKKTTIYVTITESLGDNEPLYVNLTGIRDFTGKERRIVGGCLDLSDLMISGEEAKEIIQRMAKHQFHRLDLSNNNINEFPTNTFSPVAFSVRELRLDGNPLLSNCHVEDSMLQRGGLFHLTELRELNLSSCGLRDIDFFTPWNSNRLEVVDLSANNLKSVPTNLQFFHKLKKLFLDGNPITKVSELPFALLWNLQVLSMSGCTVSSITSDPFRNMEHLKELSLEGNNLTRISDVRLPRGSSGIKMYLSSNPWHCACDMLTFIEYHHYSIRDLEDIRCATPRWLEGLRTAYLTKEILSLDSVDGDCTPPHLEVAAPIARQYPLVRADRLEMVSLIVFALAAVFMLVHILWAKRSNKYKFDDDDRHDINYIRIDRKPTFK